MTEFLNDETVKHDAAKLKFTAHGYPLLPGGKFEDFAHTLEHVAQHVSPKYFIYKSIILQNLFGVDIMPEAVEICKLRLFLKLAAQVEPDAKKESLGIEPLPDIDFNICAGNTLVGYATLAEVQNFMFAGTIWNASRRPTNKSAVSANASRRRATWQSSARTSSKSAPCWTPACSPITARGN